MICRFGVSPVDYKKLREKEQESSSVIRERVNAAKKIQLERYKEFKIYSNSELTPKLLEMYCQIDDESARVLNESMEKLQLSTRTYYKILKVARTIADLDLKENIEFEHVMEAMQYRGLEV